MKKAWDRGEDEGDKRDLGMDRGGPEERKLRDGPAGTGASLKGRGGRPDRGWYQGGAGDVVYHIAGEVEKIRWKGGLVAFPR